MWLDWLLTSSFMNIAGLDPMSSTSIARLGGTLSEEAGGSMQSVLSLSVAGGFPIVKSRTEVFPLPGAPIVQNLRSAY